MEKPPRLRAVFLKCTLKKSPAVSNTEALIDKVKTADILVVGTPIWFGVRSSVAQMVIERLDGTYTETNQAGQYPLYNKVAGVVVRVTRTAPTQLPRPRCST